ncbi:MAG TPA: PhoH family protein, partial [Allocoleopsis sp.]
LDTNVLLHDPNAMLRFEDNDVVLPITVVEELDRFKKQSEETGRNARQASRILDNLRQKQHLTTGVTLEHGGTLRVVFCKRETLQQLPAELEGGNGDNAILAVALELQKQCNCPVVMISKDTNLRIKADALGLVAADYETGKVDVEGLYTGFAEVLVGADVLGQLFKGGIALADLEGQFFANQCLMLIDSTNPAHTALAIVDGSNNKAVPLTKLPYAGISHIHARNREQQFAFELLMRDSISLVTLVGRAGTGKTLLAIATGLHKVAEVNTYSRLLIARPVVPMGRDIGYLPGDVKEKLTPWMQALFDNFDLIFTVGAQEAGEKRAAWRRGYEELMEMGLLEIEPLTYIRGRTIPKQFLIVDEAQNLTPHEAKTILTRAGEGTKVILTGDLAQIDNPYVDAASNGLAYVVERFKNEPIAGHITLQKGERSTLAERASLLL